MKKGAICFFLLCLSIPSLSEEKNLASRVLFEIDQRDDPAGQMKRPQSVSCDAQGNIFVADTGNNRVLKFDNKGRLISFIGGFGWEKEQFQMPVDLFVYNSLDIYISDFDNNRIERYDKDLNWISSTYSNINWETKYQFEFPRAIFKSLHGDYFIIDSQNDRITKFNSSFEPELTFGDFDWGQGILKKPSDLFVSLEDNVYVTDQDAGKIRVYDYFGTYLFDIGENLLVSPRGISGNDEGHIFVADSEKNQVFVFENTGALLLQIGSRGKKLGAFLEPIDVDASRNRLVVADAANNRIQVFELFWTP